MTKVILEVDGVRCEVSGGDEACLPDVLQLVEQAIKGVGFYPPENSSLDFVPTEPLYDGTEAC